jgi:hypothetical protein
LLCRLLDRPAYIAPTRRSRLCCQDRKAADSNGEKCRWPGSRAAESRCLPLGGRHEQNKYVGGPAYSRRQSQEQTENREKHEAECGQPIKVNFHDGMEQRSDRCLGVECCSAGVLRTSLLILEQKKTEYEGEWASSISSSIGRARRIGDNRIGAVLNSNAEH